MSFEDTNKNGDLFNIPEPKRVNIFDAETEEEDDEIDEEDIELSAMGINPHYKVLYSKQYPKKKCFYQGNLTKKFFSYLLDIMNEENLNAIKREKLQEKQQTLLDDRREKGPVAVIKPKSLVAQYIEKNEKLIKEVETLRKENNEFKMSSFKFKEHTKFLFNFMGKYIDESKQTTIDQVEIIEGIKEALGL